MAPMIEVRDLVKTYGDVRAVDGLSFTVEAGEFFGILGPNGAGKTTALEMIEGLRKPDAGDVRLLDTSPWPRNLDLVPAHRRAAQSTAFFEKLTAREQLRTFAELYGVARSRADDLLDQVGLAEKADARTDDLSGGQKQRLSIACTLVNEPEVVFLDEPTAALDPQARRNLWDLLEGLNDSGRTVVLTTHSMEEAETLCDRVGIVDRGPPARPRTRRRNADPRRSTPPVRIALVEACRDVDDARPSPASTSVDGRRRLDRLHHRAAGQPSAHRLGRATGA